MEGFSLLFLVCCFGHQQHSLTGHNLETTPVSVSVCEREREILCVCAGRVHGLPDQQSLRTGSSLADLLG